MKEYEATLPFEADFHNPDPAGYLNKYMMRRPGVSAEDQYRCFRLPGADRRSAGPLGCGFP